MKKTVAIACALTLCMSVSFAQTAGNETPAETTVEQTTDGTAQKKADRQAVKKTDEEAAARKAAKKSGSARTYAVPVTGVTLDKTEMEVAVHILDYSTAFPTVAATVAPDNATCKDVKWSSSDMSIVKVDQLGRLFPANVGEAVITAKTKDGAYTATCNVKITKYGPKPEIDAKITTELTGDASVTFGTDIDTGKCGFSTDQKIKLKINLLNLGEVWSDNPDALPIWGDIRIATYGDPLRYFVDGKSGDNLALNDGDAIEDGAFKIYVDQAKIHIGNAFINLYDRDNSNLGYVNYTTGPDVAYEFMGVDTKRRYGHVLETKPLHSYLTSVDSNKTVYGLQAGYEMDNVFKLSGDFASTMKWVGGDETPSKDTASKKATDWVYKITGSFLMVPKLDIEAGYSNGILGEDAVYKQDMRFGAQVSYEWDFFDIYYLKPKAGITMVQLENRGKAYPLVSGGILLGWEDKQSAFDTWFSGNRPRYLEDKYGAYPGLAIAAEYADKKLAENFVINDGRYSAVDHDILILHGSFNTGNGLLVKNLEAVGAVDAIDVLSDKMIMGTTLGLRYSMPLNKYFSIAPKAFFTRYYDTYNNDNDYMYAKAGLDFTFQKVTLSLDYESNDLLFGFNDGTAYRKAGKIETTLKVSF
jgi:hypothetical protein